MAEVELENDKEVERLGANATAQYALEFWNTLSKAARIDGKKHDALWDDVAAVNGTDTSNDLLLLETQKIVLTESAASDRLLHMRFRSNFGSLNVRNTMAQLGGHLWQSLLLASEGVVKDYNFMTLLRVDAHDIFWMSEDKVSDGLAVIARAQFLFIEIARIREGVYGRDFRRKLQLWDIKSASDAMYTALQQKDDAEAIRILQQLQSDWPYPRPQMLKSTGLVKMVKRAWKTGATDELREACFHQLQYWKDFYDLGVLAASNEGAMMNRPVLERAARSMAVGGGSPVGSNGTTASRRDVTKTTANLRELVPADKKDASRIFSQYGMLVLNDYFDQDEIRNCKSEANDAFQNLVDNQLKPRQIVVDGDNEFDFAEVRQRPGHRVDNRYKVMESPCIQKIASRLQEQLPSLLNNGTAVEYKLLYGGVVHSFPRKHEADSIPEPQLWHRDGPSLFPKEHHETHCFNVFIPLVNVSTANGTTEFIPGSHNDVLFEELMMDLLRNWSKSDQQHELAVRADVDVGSMVIFDVRLLHRGLANASMEERPLLYFTFSRTWFMEEHMFDDTSIIESSPDASASRGLSTMTNGSDNGYQNGISRKSEPIISIPLDRLYEMVSGQSPPVDEVNYGHPHYTTRFDLLITELDDQKKKQNMNAILEFLSSSGPDDLGYAFVDMLRSPSSVARKKAVLKEARRLRKEQRVTESDFGTFETDMGDVCTLYQLTADLIMKESWYLSKLGFSPDQDGITILLATLKAYSLRETAKVSLSSLEEAFSAWWHAGIDRFQFKRVGTKPAARVLVVFSSLGSGIARPEWGASLSRCEPCDDFDILHVLDPSFSWYCQDPSCKWQGGDWYYNEIQERTAEYEAVMFLGDSMGGAAALRFSSLAHALLTFSPQVDISCYPAITRTDFMCERRQDFERQLIHACSTTSAHMLIHYGEGCDEDVRAVMLLPTRRHIKLVAHEYDDHILSLHLRQEGKLQHIVNEAIDAFLGASFKKRPAKQPAPTLPSAGGVLKWLVLGGVAGGEDVQCGLDISINDSARSLRLSGAFPSTSFDDEQADDDDSVIPVFDTQLDVIMTGDGDLVFVENVEEEIVFS